jgi:hypothetical protein
MPSPSQMAERVLAAHHIREEDGKYFTFYSATPYFDS